MRDLPLHAYRPRQMVRRELTALDPQPPAPMVVHAHNHLGAAAHGHMVGAGRRALIGLMDTLGVETIVNLDGMWGEELDANLDRYDPGASGPVRHLRAVGSDAVRARRLDGAGLAGRRRLRSRCARPQGAGEDLGLHLRDASGALVMPDDARLDPVWDAVATAGRPVHQSTVGDPAAFFEPLDEHNERLEELLENPDWWFGDRDRFPTFDPNSGLAPSPSSARRSDVTWVGAHVLCAAEDLAWVDRVLSTYPNAFADVAARICPSSGGSLPRDP